MTNKRPFSPLDKRALAESIEREVLSQQPMALGTLAPFEGAGVYIIYYSGDFELYAPLARRNRKAATAPIYIGEAVPPGARKGSDFDAPHGNALFKRLSEHAKSVAAATSTLKLEDFTCRFLAVDDVWIPLGEHLLIQNFKPVWNLVMDGFGNHDPGGNRPGRTPSWDVIHPGRPWTARLKPSKFSEAEIRARVDAHFARAK